MYNVIGNDRPSSKDLHDYVVEEAAQKWKDLGKKLLPFEACAILDVIEADHLRDADSCCKRVLREWLETTSEEATWNELIRALRSPSVQLNTLAGRLEQMLSTECK